MHYCKSVYMLCLCTPLHIKVQLPNVQDHADLWSGCISVSPRIHHFVTACNELGWLLMFLFAVVLHHTSAAEVNFGFIIASYSHKAFWGSRSHSVPITDLQYVNMFITFLLWILECSFPFSFWSRYTTRYFTISAYKHSLYFARERWLVIHLYSVFTRKSNNLCLVSVDRQRERENYSPNSF